MNKLKIGTFVIILSLIGVIAFRGIKKSDKKQPVITVSAKRRTINKVIVIPGTIIPIKEIDIKSVFSGVMENLFVKIGDKVKMGDPLAQVKLISDPIEIQQTLEKFEIANTQYLNNKKTYQRYKQLWEKKVISNSELDQIETTYETSKLTYESIKTQMEMLTGSGKRGSSSNIIKATSDGTILEIPIKLGGAIMARSTYNEGTTITKIANLESLTFSGKVSEGDVGYLRTGANISLRLNAIKEQSFNAVLTLIAPKGQVINGITQFDINANVIVPKKGPMIRAGYGANAEILVDSKKDVLSLEEKYLQFSNDSTFVEILGKGNEITKRYINTGISDGINTEVVSGLTSKDKIKPPDNKQDKVQ